MTKIEALRENILEVAEQCPPDMENQLKRDLDSLIAAVREEERARLEESYRRGEY